MAESSLEGGLWSPALLSTGLILLAAFLANTFFRSRRHLQKKAFDAFNGPLLGEAGSPDFREAMVAGYTKVIETIFHTFFVTSETWDVL